MLRHKKSIVGVIYRKRQSNINEYFHVIGDCLKKVDIEQKQA